MTTLNDSIEAAKTIEPPRRRWFTAPDLHRLVLDLSAENKWLLNEIDRLKAALERIETASRHWAEYEAAPDAVHYAHESTARLASAALAEGGKDG